MMTGFCITGIYHIWRTYGHEKNLRMRLTICSQRLLSDASLHLLLTCTDHDTLCCTLRA